MVRNRVTETQMKSYEEIDNALMEIGSKKREIGLIEVNMNEQINQLKSAAKEESAPLIERVKLLETAIKDYCEAHRADFLKVKTRELQFGSVGFRLSTKIVVKKVANCIQTLKDMELWQFLRIKEEPDKEAMRDLDDETLAAICAARKTEEVFGYTLNEEKLKEAA